MRQRSHPCSATTDDEAPARVRRWATTATPSSLLLLFWGLRGAAAAAGSSSSSNAQEASSSCRDLAYPVLRPTREIFDIWGADEIQGTTHTPEGDIARFNWSDPQERAAAETYKACELPFKFYGVPELDEVTALWTDDYLSEKMPTSIYTVLRSESSRFMWYDKRLRKDEMMAQDPTVPEDWLTPPTDIDPKMAYPEWSRLAREADALGLGPDSPHWYLEAQAPKKGSEGNFIYEDLGLFRAVPDSFWVPEPEQNRGIQCRLGMRGITAASHFDSGRNFVAIISGSKRYVLHPPSQCPNLGIIPFPKHPSFRHSSLDWADEDELQGSLGSALGAQTILSTGEILYIPSFWFHWIVSLGYNIQCNTRHGLPEAPHRRRDSGAIRACLTEKREADLLST